MRKTTVYLTDAQKRGLERLAATSGRSEAELIRSAVDQLVESAPPRRPIIGIFDIDCGDFASRDEELLRHGFGRD